MEPTNEIFVESSSSHLNGISTPDRQSTIDHYQRVEYNKSPLPTIIQAADELHCPGGIANYSFKIIHPGSRLTKKKINILNPIGHLITQSWSNIKNEYMIDILNCSLITIEVTKDGSYEMYELIIKMKKGEDLRLMFENIDEARDCQLYLYSIINL